VTETQGVVLTEAMAVGLPCVAARAYGAAQIVRDGSTGFLTEPTVEALATAALTLLQRPALRQQMSRQSRAAAQSFSSHKLAQQLVATYENALRGLRSD
jgi:glycosyltransferase involved in cell wall biosynthesis